MHRLLRNSSLFLSIAAIVLTSNALGAEGEVSKYKIVKKLPLEGAHRFHQ